MRIADPKYGRAKDQAGDDEQDQAAEPEAADITRHRAVGQHDGAKDGGVVIHPDTQSGCRR